MQWNGLYVIWATVEKSGRVPGNESLHPCDISVISDKYHVPIFGNLRWFSISVGWELVTDCKDLLPRSTQPAVGNVMRERYRNSISISGGSKELAKKLKCF